MESSKSINTKASQFEIMVQYMHKHPDLSKGYLKTPEARHKSEILWTNLSNDLNAEGPPVRSAVRWKKVWADFKVHTKSKLRKNRMNLSVTDCGPPKYHSLTPLEKKVSELLDLNHSVDEMNRSSSMDDINCNMEQYAYDDDAVGMHETVVAGTEMEISLNGILSAEKENVPQQRITSEKRHTSLLQKQVDNQYIYQNNMYAVMKDINENLKGIFKYTRRDFELQEKNYKLKKEKLELKKQKFEFKKQCQAEKYKNTIAELELKKEILRLRQKRNAPH